MLSSSGIASFKYLFSNSDGKLGTEAVRTGRFFLSIGGGMALPTSRSLVEAYFKVLSILGGGVLLPKSNRSAGDVNDVEEPLKSRIKQENSMKAIDKEPIHLCKDKG